MRKYVNGDRGSGRTTKFIQELPEEAEQLFVVAGTFSIASDIKHTIASLRGLDFAKKVRPMSISSLHTLRGLDPFQIFFEHTAYEFASAEQLKEIYFLEDRGNLWSEQK
jgi:hypothetical protein